MSRVVVAGTFGPIHDGHRALFRAALCRGKDGVLVCLTSDEFARSSRDREVPNYEERLAAVRREISEQNRWDRPVEYRDIEGPYDVAATEPALDKIVVSTETEDEVIDINDRRSRRGLDELDSVVVPLVLAADGERLSSTRIVAGEVDECGTLQV